MNDIETGGPAFPSHGSMGEVAHEGMTLRDYFAAVELGATWRPSITSEEQCKSIAIHCFLMADLMLAARAAK